MELYYKLFAVYPELTEADFHPRTGFIELHDKSNGEGAYIAKWEHPTLAQPTQEQLDAVEAGS